MAFPLKRVLLQGLAATDLPPKAATSEPSPSRGKDWAHKAIDEPRCGPFRESGVS